MGEGLGLSHHPSCISLGSTMAIGIKQPMTSPQVVKKFRGTQPLESSFDMPYTLRTWHYTGLKHGSMHTVISIGGMTDYE
jgi:hypothetical protein